MSPALRGWKIAIMLLAVVACFAGTVLAQLRLDHHRSADLKEELLYLPNERLLDHFTVGMNSVIANMLWVQCIQYTAQEARGDRGFEWLNHMLQTVVRLDPYFVDAYRYGGMFLAALKADDDAGLKLLQQGMLHNPRAWELPYEAGMIYLLNRRDWPGSKRMAAYYLGISAATGTAPPRIVDIAARLQEDFEISDIEREMWVHMAQSEDTFMREIAERKLIELSLREAQQYLQQVVDYYRQREGALPTDLAALLQAGYLEGLPEDPLGGHFHIARDGSVYSTTLLEHRLNTTQNALQRALDRYHEAEGHWPESLETLVEAGRLREIPEHPYPDHAWGYDPTTGEIDSELQPLEEIAP